MKTLSLTDTDCLLKTGIKLNAVYNMCLYITRSSLIMWSVNIIAIIIIITIIIQLVAQPEADVRADSKSFSLKPAEKNCNLSN